MMNVVTGLQTLSNPIRIRVRIHSFTFIHSQRNKLNVCLFELKFGFGKTIVLFQIQICNPVMCLACSATKNKQILYCLETN